MYSYRRIIFRYIKVTLRESIRLPLIFGTVSILCGCSPKIVQFGLNSTYKLQKNEKVIKPYLDDRIKQIQQENKGISEFAYLSKMVFNKGTNELLIFSFCSQGLDTAKIQSYFSNVLLTTSTQINASIQDTVVVYKVHSKYVKYIFREYGFPHYIIIDHISDKKEFEDSTDIFKRLGILKSLH